MTYYVSTPGVLPFAYYYSMHPHFNTIDYYLSRERNTYQENEVVPQLPKDAVPILAEEFERRCTTLQQEDPNSKCAVCSITYAKHEKSSLAHAFKK